MKRKLKTKKEADSLSYGIGIDSMNRFEIFLNNIDKLPDRLYWYALRNAYDCSDNLYRYKELVKSCFTCERKYNEKLMLTKERNILAKLPERIKIYRGMTEKEYYSGDYGISWTLYKPMAEFFAFVYPRNYSTNHLKKMVAEAEVAKSNIIAFLNDRTEQELIIDPGVLLKNNVKKCLKVNQDPIIVGPAAEKENKMHLKSLTQNKKHPINLPL